ncbi:MAG: hypothetical protein ACTHWA_10740 [Arachnia sp.]
MDSTERNSQSNHIQSLAFAELDVANRELMEAGRTIEKLRSDVLALAVRVDGARAEAESFRNEAQSLAQQNAASTEQQQALASQIAENTATHAALKAHIARLKLQLARPEKLLVKKVMRRGPYSTPDAT